MLPVNLVTRLVKHGNGLDPGKDLHLRFCTILCSGWCSRDLFSHRPSDTCKEMMNCFASSEAAGKCLTVVQQVLLISKITCDRIDHFERTRGNTYLCTDLPSSPSPPPSQLGSKNDPLLLHAHAASIQYTRW